MLNFNKSQTYISSWYLKLKFFPAFNNFYQFKQGVTKMRAVTLGLYSIERNEPKC